LLRQNAGVGPPERNLLYQARAREQIAESVELYEMQLQGTAGVVAGGGAAIGSYRIADGGTQTTRKRRRKAKDWSALADDFRTFLLERQSLELTVSAT
jgi:hypothetical protein